MKVQVGEWETYELYTRFGKHRVLIEDLRIATSLDPPTATDAAGNPYIGL